MRTINFNEEDIKESKLALASQRLTSLQSAILMQYINNLEAQLEVSEKARKSSMDYLTSYESISTIQSLDNIEQNKGLDEKTMNEMIRRYSVVHDEVLKMLDIKDSDK